MTGVNQRAVIKNIGQFAKYYPECAEDIERWTCSNHVSGMPFYRKLWHYLKNDPAGNLGKCATAFNQNISRWNVSNVKIMKYMFESATSFNQDISGWDVSNVRDMRHMFDNAASFRQDISGWNVSNVTDNAGIFYDCPIENHSGQQPDFNI